MTPPDSTDARGAAEAVPAATPSGLREVDWARLLTPARVAVIGATDTEGTQARAQFLQLRERLDADVVPVHPTKAEVLGVHAHPTIGDVPGPVDVAVVLVRDPLPVVEECAAAGVAFTIVFSAGFGEVGTDEGRAAEQRLRDLARGPMRILGPNTNLNLYEPWPTGRPGSKLAVVTQSGNQGRPIVQGDVLGIAIERWATLGNEADLEWADLVGLFATTEGVGAIATYVEGFRDGATMMRAADAAARAGVPIVCVKVGRSDEGRTMARAHTGHLTGPDAVHDAVFDRFGVIRVDDLDELIEISGLFCHARPGDGRGGVALYAMSGGTASHVADLCGQHGVPLPRFADATVEALGAHLPSFLRRDNPVDSGGVITARPENRDVLQLMLDDPATEILFAPITGVFPGMSDALARDLVALAAASDKTVVTAWLSPQRDDPAYRLLCDAGVAMFHSFQGAVRGMGALLRHRRFVRGYRSPFATHPPGPPAGAVGPGAVAGRGTLDEVAAKRVLASYGVPVVAEEVVADPGAAVAAADRLGYPVAVKLVPPGVAHKSDLGLVRLGVVGPAEVERAVAELIAADPTRAPIGPAGSAAPWTGTPAGGAAIVAQPMVDGVELLVGVSHQQPFGPTITVGLGGILAEVVEDVAFLVPPFDADDAVAALRSLRAAPVLAGTRGRPGVDLDAVARILLAVQAMALDLGDALLELDINPLVAGPPGTTPVAVDALIVAR